MVINFLVLCLSFSLVYFKNGPEYITMGDSPEYLYYIRFMLYSFVASRFLVLLRCSFVIFSFIYTCLMVSGIYKYLQVSFSSSFLLFVFFNFVLRFLPSCVVSRFSLLIWHILLCQIPFLYLDCIFSLSELGFLIFYYYYYYYYYYSWVFLPIVTGDLHSQSKFS